MKILARDSLIRLGLSADTITKQFLPYEKGWAIFGGVIIERIWYNTIHVVCIYSVYIYSNHTHKLSGLGDVAGEGEREGLGEGGKLNSKVEFTVMCQEFTTFVLSTWTIALQSLNYAEFKSIQVLHTYSVSQPLPDYLTCVSLWNWCPL